MPASVSTIVVLSAEVVVVSRYQLVPSFLYYQQLCISISQYHSCIISRSGGSVTLSTGTILVVLSAGSCGSVPVSACTGLVILL